MQTAPPGFEKLDNFRDFGGYPAADGRRIRRGRLFRSAQHSRMTDQDLARLEALNLAAVVDLRLPAERERQPSRRPPGFAGRIVVSDQGSEGDSPWRMFVHRENGFTAQQACDWVLDWYRQAPFEPQHLEAFQRYFALLPELDGGVLIHCAAGKDRTGLLAALTHHLLGVAPEHIEHDYLLTNHDAGYARYLPILRSTVAAVVGSAPDEAALRAAIWIESRYLQTAFAAIIARHGSVDRYLHDALGVDAERRAAIREQLLDADPPVER